MKCSKCGCKTIEMVWVKTMAVVTTFDQYALERAELGRLLSYTRRELLYIVEKDVKNKLNMGEVIYCLDCYKELDK